MGAQTLFFDTLRDREPILDLFERLFEQGNLLVRSASGLP